jgi:hypothetical protein
VYAVELTFSTLSDITVPSTDALRELVRESAESTGGEIQHARVHYLPGQARVVVFVVAGGAREAEAIASRAALRAATVARGLQYRGCRVWEDANHNLSGHAPPGRPTDAEGSDDDDG